MEDFLENPNFIPLPLQRNNIIEGTILTISDREVSVDLGSRAEGIILGKELQAEKEFMSGLKVGDMLLSSVMQVENEHGQVVLSLKRAGLERRWRMLDSSFEDKKPVKVRVLDFNKGGLIVDCGIRGFVPISQLSRKHLPNSGNKKEIQERLDGLKGKEIDVYVLEVNRRSNKLIFSSRSVEEIHFSKSQKEKILKKVQVDDEIKGVVTRIVPFGILVDIGGMEGLVHISEVFWDRLKKPESKYSVGDKVKVLVLEKNEEKGKVFLSLKRLQKDPWESVGDKYSENTEVEGVVTKITSFGAFVRVDEGIDGLVHSSKLLELNLDLHEGDKGLFKIINLNVPLKRMGLEPIVAKE